MAQSFLKTFFPSTSVNKSSMEVNSRESQLDNSAEDVDSVDILEDTVAQEVDELSSDEKSETSAEDSDRDIVQRKRPKYTETRRKRKFSSRWLKEPAYKLWLVRTADGMAYCKLCPARLRPQKTRLDEHVKSKKHVEAVSNFESLRDIRPQTSSTSVEISPSVKIAELNLGVFAAMHCSARTIDHLAVLVSRLFHEDSTAQKIKLDRTKCAALIKSVLRPALRDELIEDMKGAHFSLIIDESIDVGIAKMLAIVVRYFSRRHRKIVTTFYRIILLDACNTDAITTAILKCLQKDGLERWQLIGIGTDNANVMFGSNSSVFTKLKEEQPSLVLMPCVCHSLALAASKAVETLPTNLDFMIEKTYNWFARSSTRISSFPEIYKLCDDDQAPKKMLRHCETRWLSRFECIRRVLDQWDELSLYFQQARAEQRDFVVARLAEMYKDNVNRHFLTFLASQLEIITQVNEKFQSEDANPLKLLKHLVSCYKTILQRIVLPAYFRQLTNSNIRSFDFERHLRSPETIDISWELNDAFEKCGVSNEDRLRILERCRTFMVELAKQIRNRLPDNTDVLELVRWLDPRKAITSDPGVIRPLVRRFVDININRERIVTEYGLLHKYTDWDRSKEIDPVAFWIDLHRKEGDISDAYHKMSQGFLGSLVQKFQQVLTHDPLLSAGDLEILEIPENHLRPNSTVYVKHAGAFPDLNGTESIFILQHVQSQKFHLAIRCVSPKTVKTFSVLRSADYGSLTAKAVYFTDRLELIKFVDSDDKFKALMELVHRNAGQDWKDVHFAAAVGCVRYFESLRNRLDTSEIVRSRCTPDGQMPLHIAIGKRQAVIVNILLSLGADVTLTDKNGMNALHYAVGSSEEILRILCTHNNASVAVNASNISGKTPLHLAVLAGDSAAVIFMINAGADGTIRCDGKTLIEMAVRSPATPNQTLIKSIAKAFPMLAVERNSVGDTALHYCEDRDVLKELIHGIAGNVTFDLRNSKGDTPLHVAVRRADLPTFVKLWAYGANLDVRNDTGMTPMRLSLSLCAQGGQLQILKALLIFGADCALITESDINNVPVNLRQEIVNMFFAIGAEGCPFTDARRFQPTFAPAAVVTNALHDLKHSICVERLRQQKNKHFKHLLALDGGGMKGVILIQMLLALEKQVGEHKLVEKFDWVAGTSTGAIVASGFSVGRPLRAIQRSYFRMKDLVFDTTLRPYDALTLEACLKEDFGETTTMADLKFKSTKLIITAAEANVLPTKLHLIRSYRLPVSADENVKLGYVDPRSWQLWKAIRCSSAAPTYFSSVDNRFVDGGLIANNPTLDLLTEVCEFEFASKALEGNCDLNVDISSDIGCVVSLGCGDIPEIPAVTPMMDVAVPSGFMEAVYAAFAVKNLGNILINQVTAAGGRPVDRSRMWCYSMNVPFFRFSPPLFKDLPLDTVDDGTLVEILWGTIVYLYENKERLKELASLIA